MTNRSKKVRENIKIIFTCFIRTRCNWKERVTETYKTIIIRFIRTKKDRFYDGMLKHNDVYEDQEDGSFRALYTTLCYHFCKTMYWFCVWNARYKKE